MDNPFKSPSVLSICTGMRGLERGLESVIGKFGNVTYVEIEAFIVFNLVRQMEQGVLDSAPVWTNLKTFDPRPFHGKIHGIVGGYPCQPFSVAGKLEGTDDPRHLWPYIEKSIRAIKPVWCFFENVANHLNIGYREVKQSLESMGYTVKEGIYTAEEVGAPHKRERLFILAIMVDPGSQRTGAEYREICRAYEKISKRDYNAKFVKSGSELADTLCSNGGEIQTKRSLTGNNGELVRNGHKWSNVFPAGQGQYQHPWEEPRTVEPGLGFTAHGYDFTTDLLRMAGNGVVEQSAAVAFIDLLRKHCEL